MRATSNPPTPAQNADAVWDEDVNTEHQTANTAGNFIGLVKSRILTIHADYGRRTAYTYGPTSLASGATYVPAAGTVVTVALLDGVAADDFHIVHGTVQIFKIGDQAEFWVSGYVGALYCDGTNVGIKNADAAGRDLSIEGFTP